MNNLRILAVGLAVALAANFLLAGLAVAQVAKFSSERTKLTIYQDFTAAEPGGELTLGLNFELAPDWYIYWQNPGDSGLPPKIKLNQNELLTARTPVFPIPEIKRTAGIVDFVYNQAALIRYPFSLNPNTRAKSASISGRVTWLVCKVDCIPEELEFTLDLAIGASAKAASFDRIHLKQATPPETPVTFKRSANNFQIILPALQTTDQIYYAPAQAAQQILFSQQVQSSQKEIPVISLKKNSDFTADSLPDGFVFVTTDTGAQQVYRPLVKAAESSSSLLKILLFAFLGGLILNFMPCVFPIVAIKLFELSRLGGANRLAALRSSILYSAGIISFLLLLFFIIEGLKLLGYSAGWGFQMQSRVFVSFLILLFVLLGLSFVGVFDRLFYRLQNLFANSPRLQSNNSFFSGALTTLVATPCSAPFLGAALGATLTLNFFAAGLVFVCMGLGLSLPYLLIASSEKFLAIMPKPGPWLGSFKVIMAIPMFLTAAWLLFFAFPGKGAEPSGQENAYGMQYQSFSQETLARELAADRIVFVDFTADWCLTCLLNKQLVFNSGKVADYFRNNNVSLLVADWTDYDQEITEELARFKRRAVPFNVIYSRDQKPEVLPTVLTANIVLNKLKELNEKNENKNSDNSDTVVNQSLPDSAGSSS